MRISVLLPLILAAVLPILSGCLVQRDNIDGMSVFVTPLDLLLYGWHP